MKEEIRSKDDTIEILNQQMLTKLQDTEKVNEEFKSEISKSNAENEKLTRELAEARKMLGEILAHIDELPMSKRRM